MITRTHLRVLERLRDVDRDDLRVRVRAAQHGAVEHPREHDVVEVLALAADEARVLLALHAAVAHRRGLRGLGGCHAQLLGDCGGLVLGRPADCSDDVGVTGAAADRARDRLPDLLLGRVGVRVEQRPRGHDHPRGAEAALQAVLLVESLLDRVEHAVDLERLDRADLVPLGHRGEHRARLHRPAVHLHHAGAAVGRVAAPVRAGEPRRVADEVDEQQRRLDLPRDRLAVDRDRDLHQTLLSSSPRRRAPQRAAG